MIHSYSLETTYVPEWDVRLYRINCKCTTYNKNVEPTFYYLSVMAGWNYGGEIHPDSIKSDVLDVIWNTYPGFGLEIIEEDGELIWKTDKGNRKELYM